MKELSILECLPHLSSLQILKMMPMVQTSLMKRWLNESWSKRKWDVEIHKGIKIRKTMIIKFKLNKKLKITMKNNICVNMSIMQCELAKNWDLIRLIFQIIIIRCNNSPKATIIYQVKTSTLNTIVTRLWLSQELFQVLLQAKGLAQVNNKIYVILVILTICIRKWLIINSFKIWNPDKQVGIQVITKVILILDHLTLQMTMAKLANQVMNKMIRPRVEVTLVKRVLSYVTVNQHLSIKGKSWNKLNKQVPSLQTLNLKANTVKKKK